MVSVVVCRERQEEEEESRRGELRDRLTGPIPNPSLTLVCVCFVMCLSYCRFD